MMFWKQQGQPKTGATFPINYNQYNTMFHKTRKLCQSRISEDHDTMRLHIFRRTHGQYCQRLGLPLELICGDAPNGRFGVGWKDPKIPLRYYISAEDEEIAEKELTFMQKNPQYQTVLNAMQENNRKIKAILNGIGN